LPSPVQWQYQRRNPIEMINPYSLVFRLATFLAIASFTNSPSTAGSVENTSLNKLIAFMNAGTLCSVGPVDSSCGWRPVAGEEDVYKGGRGRVENLSSHLLPSDPQYLLCSFRPGAPFCESPLSRCPHPVDMVVCTLWSVTELRSSETIFFDLSTTKHSPKSPNPQPKKPNMRFSTALILLSAAFCAAAAPVSHIHKQSV